MIVSISPCHSRFLSFCRVGTGLSDEELNTLLNKLKPYFVYMFCLPFLSMSINISSILVFWVQELIHFLYDRKNEYPKRMPRFYEVTNNSKERPDVWIESPDKLASCFFLKFCLLILVFSYLTVKLYLTYCS